MKELEQAVLDEMFASQMRPVNLITFELDGLTLRYAASKTNVTFDGDTYTAKAFEYGDVLQTSEGQIGRVSVRMDNVGATLSAFAASYVFAGRTMFIYKVYRDALGAGANFEEVFRGKMEAPRFTNTLMELTATAGASLTRRYPHRIYQRLCPHTFGAGDCARELEGEVSGQGSIGNEKFEFVVGSEATDIGAYSGTVTDGTSTKIFDADDFIGHENDAWNGRQLTWISGVDNEGLFENIDDFDSTNGRFTFTVGFVGPPGTGDLFVIGAVFVGYRIQWKTGNNAGEFAQISSFVPHHNAFGGDAFFAVDAGDAFTADIEAGDTFIISNADLERAPLKQSDTLSATSSDDVTAIDNTRSEADDFWNFGKLTITNGAVTETRTVVTFVNSTSTFTVDLPYSFTPTSGDSYSVIAGCDKSWVACQARDVDELMANEGFEAADLRVWSYVNGLIDSLESEISKTIGSDTTKTTGNGYVDDEFNGRELRFTSPNSTNFRLSRDVSDFDAQAGKGKFTTVAFPDFMGLRATGSSTRDAPYDVEFVATDNTITRDNLTYTVEAAAKQGGAVGLNITAGAAQDFELGQTVLSGYEERDALTATASINIDNAATVTSITLKIYVMYDGSSRAWELLGSDSFNVATKGSWQTATISAIETDGAKVLKIIKFAIEGVALNGTVFIDDCSMTRNVVPYGPVADNTENFGGFIHIGREGDMPLVGI
jgi:hypothetical protein